MLHSPLKLLWVAYAGLSLVGLAQEPSQQALQVSPPLSASESLTKIHVPKGFKVELVASEPLLLDPVAFDWDARGRLWVVEMADYPMGMDGNGKAGGRIRRLEDRDGDGKYEHSVIFAEGLNFPTGILCWRDGILVTAAPEILFLRDKDNDGKMDDREVLIRGFHEGNQQLRVNGLRWGTDNWVYCAIGAHTAGYGKEAELTSLRNGQTVAIGARDFRFRPDTGEIDPQSGPTQFGRNRDAWGHWFGTQNSWPLWHYVLPDHYLRRNPHFAAPSPRHDLVRPANPKVYPVSPPMKRYHSFNQAGHFTAACSGMIYGDEWLFPDLNKLQAFTCEPAGNLIQSNRLSHEGATFRAERFPSGDTPDFFASEDPWCRPVMVRTGPDGALWIADMYRFMIEHPHWLPQEGKDELLPYYRLGEDAGRIYRVVPEGKVAPQFKGLDGLKGAELIAALNTANDTVRDLIHRLIIWDQEKADVKSLKALIRNEKAHPKARAQALSILDGLKKFDLEDLRVAFKDPHPGVRENAIRVSESFTDAQVIHELKSLIGDQDAKVQLQLAFSLGAWQDQVAGEILASLLPLADHTQPWLQAAIMSSATPHVQALVNFLVKADTDLRRQWDIPLSRMLLAMGNREDLARLLASTLHVEGDQYTLVQLERSTDFLHLLREMRLTLAQLITTAPDDRLSQALKKYEGISKIAEKMGTDESLPASDRISAWAVYGLASNKQSVAVAQLSTWLNSPSLESDLLKRIIGILATFPQSNVTEQFAKIWPSLTPENRLVVLDEWLNRESWVIDLLKRLEAGQVKLADIDATRRTRLLHHPSKKIKELAESVFKAAEQSPRAQVVEQYRQALTLKGDPEKGHQIFLSSCSACHQKGNEGRALGPDLSSVVDHPEEKILTNILNPNVDIQPGYQAYSCRLKSGGDLFGLIASETAHSITMKMPDGSERIVLRKDIAALSATGISLMPDGLEAAISVEDMAHLIRFLKSTKAP